MIHFDILTILILLSGFYMAWNIGANDVANAMGTSVGSTALTLRQAIVLAAILEFCGAFFFGSHVSETIQNGIINSQFFVSNPKILVYGMLASLIGTGLWLQFASYWGWPVSATHTIIGALVGFGLLIGGYEAIYWEKVGFILSSWILSPILGGILSYAIFTFLRMKIFYHPNPVEAAKKLIPILSFLVIFMLSLVILFHGIEGHMLNLNLWHAFLISLFLSLCCAIIGKIYVNRVVSPSEHVKIEHVVRPEIALQLEKAKRHLQQAKLLSQGELEYQIETLLDELQCSSQIQAHPEEKTHEEFAVIEKMFAYLQIISACLMAFSHGANDVANAIGPLSAAIGILNSGLIALQAETPSWALALGGIGIVVGLATWGWRVIETIGKKITELTPTRGFSAEFGAAFTILIASRLGLPISTTHTLVGAVIGVGLARGIEALNLGMVREIAASWILTVPAGAIMSVCIFTLLVTIFGSSKSCFI